MVRLSPWLALILALAPACRGQSETPAQPAAQMVSQVAMLTQQEADFLTRRTELSVQKQKLAGPCIFIGKF